MGKCIIWLMLGKRAAFRDRNGAEVMAKYTCMDNMLCEIVKQCVSECDVNVSCNNETTGPCNYCSIFICEEALV